MADRTQNINIGGKGHNLQVGDGNTQQVTQSFAGDNSVTFEQFVQALQKELPPESVERVQAEVIEPLKQIAAEEEPTNEQDRVTLKTRIMAIVAQLEPYTPYVRKTIAAFAEGALSTLPPPAGWVIAGCIEVVRDARRD